MLVHDPSSATTGTKFPPETIAQFRTISHEFLSLVSDYRDTSPKSHPSKYCTIIDSLQHMIADLEMMLGMVRIEIEENRLVHNQVLSK